MRLFPLLIFALLLSTLITMRQNTLSMQPTFSSEQISTSARMYLQYRSAVMGYMTTNPSFTGVIPSSALTNLYGQQFSTAFLASAGNAVTVAGSGRQMTVYAALPTGTLSAILQQSGNDASIGVSAGTSWTTQAPGVVATPQPLAVAVPAGDIVSVFQKGTTS
jgi:hypothetical protein